MSEVMFWNWQDHIRFLRLSSWKKLISKTRLFFKVFLLLFTTSMVPLNLAWISSIAFYKLLLYRISLALWMQLKCSPVILVSSINRTSFNKGKLFSCLSNYWSLFDHRYLKQKDYSLQYFSLIYFVTIAVLRP